MADVAAPVPPPPARGTMSGAMGTVLRMVAMYMVMSYLRPAAKAPGGMAGIMSKSLPKFQKGYLLDMYVFLSEQHSMRHYDMSELIWSETGIELGNTKEKRSYTVTYEPSKVSGPVFLTCIEIYVDVVSSLGVTEAHFDYRSVNCRQRSGTDLEFPCIMGKCQIAHASARLLSAYRQMSIHFHTMSALIC